MVKTLPFILTMIILSIMLMLGVGHVLFFSEYDWDATWGGQIEIQTEENSEDYIALPFSPNCAVLFDGSLEHRGLDPNRFAQCERKTLAFLFEEV